MRIEKINEQIKVGAVFGKKIEPRWFFWNNKKYQIEDITYIWETREGNIQTIYFSVSDGTNTFEIKLEKNTLKWHIEKVYIE